MAGIPQFERKVHGIEEMNQELQKLNADSKRNSIIGWTGAITGVLGLIVAIIALFVD